MNRFLGDRRSTNEIEIKNDKLEIHIIEKNIDLPSIVFSFEDKYYFVNNKEFGEFKTLQNFKKI